METKEGVALARQPVILERSPTSLFSLLREAVTELEVARTLRTPGRREKSEISLSGLMQQAVNEYFSNLKQRLNSDSSGLFAAGRRIKSI